MSSLTRGTQTWILVALGAVLLGSFAIRSYGLTYRGMGHAESYTPNIELPTDYGEPRARLTLPRTVINSMWEPHPPGWYIMMWFYTKVTGTGLIAIRMPSVIFGVLTVLLTFILGRMESDSLTALVAAILVGFGGHQILFSQIARPATLLCALGLLSSILLLHTLRHGSRKHAWLYIAVTVVGVSVEHYYWLLFAGQMIFGLLQYAGNPRLVRPTFDYQIVALIAAAPFLALAASQTGGAGFIEPEIGRPIGDLLGLGFLFEHDSNKAPALVDALNPYLTVCGAALVLTGLLRFGATRPTDERERTPLTSPSIWFIATLAVISSGAVAAAAFFLSAAKNRPLIPILATVIVPPAACAGAMILRRYEEQLTALVGSLPARIRAWCGGLSLTAVMLVAPVTLAAAVSIIKPVLVSRHLMAFVPFLLLIAARGLVRIGSFRPRWLSVATLAVVVTGLLGAYAVGYAYQSTALPGPHDYRGLSKVWIPRIQPSDVILVRNQFRSTPIFYYMPPSRFNFVGLDHVNEVRRRRPTRIWVMLMDGVAVEPEILKALTGYHLVSSVSAEHMRADLYEPDGG